MNSTATDHIPESPEELTSEWLSHALGRQVQVTGRELLGEGVGFLGDIVRVKLAGDTAGAPASVVAKIPKKANRAMGEMLGVYEREVLFFDELAERVPVTTPKIFFSHYDPDAGSAKQKEILKVFDGLPRFLNPLIAALGKRIATAKKRRYLLIMEDLGALAPGDQLAGASVDDCAVVLQAIAASHRDYWNADILDEKFWLLPMDVDARLRHGMFRQVLPVYKTSADPGLSPFLDWFADHGEQLVRTLSAQAPTTLVHCDLRLDNVCFGDGAITLIDWQLVRSGPAAYDVAYFLSSALAPETPAAEVDGLLRGYHGQLGVADYPYDQFLRDYQRGLMMTLPSLAPTEDIAIDAGRGQEMMERWRQRLQARLAGVQVDGLLDS